jgi:hypothetical protein
VYRIAIVELPRVEDPRQLDWAIEDALTAVEGHRNAIKLLEEYIEAVEAEQARRAAAS